MNLQGLSPILWTKSLEQTIAFYEIVLGFTARSNFPNFVSLFHGDVQIMFVHPTEDPAAHNETGNIESFFPKPAMTGSVYIFTDKVDQLWETVIGKATIKSAIADRDYAMRDFSIFDNNGYELCFGQDISNR